MAIVVFLVAVALVVALGLLVVVIVSLFAGGLLSRRKLPKALTAIFLFAIPAGALGAAAGAVAIGYLAVQRNESLILLGPLGGLIIGGIGGLLGGARAGALWIRRTGGGAAQ